MFQKQYCLFFRVRCGTLNSNQSEEYECAMEFPLSHFNVLLLGLSLYYLAQTSNVYGLTREAWWRHGNTFASHHYSLDLTPDYMWDVFHPLTANAWWIPLGFSSTVRRAWNCSDWNTSHKAYWPGQNLFWVT